MNNADIYFNDNEPFVVPWLQSLFPDATVDPKSILNLRPGLLKLYERVHLFAGIGGWEYALRLAGWPDDVPVWTGSCPCQPFSTAGKRKGEADERHLWPVFRDLIDECRPPVIFGEQVASADGRIWLSRVRADLEEMGYGVGAADLCAAGVAAPHLRQRLYWVAYAQRSAPLAWRPADEPREGDGAQGSGSHAESERRGDVGGLGDPDLQRTGRDSGSLPGAQAQGQRGGAFDWSLIDVSNLPSRRMADAERHDRRAVESLGRPEGRTSDGGNRPGDGDSALGLGDTDDAGPQGRFFRRDGTSERFARPTGLGTWGEFDLIECIDGKTRRFEPSSFPLAHGVPARVGRIRAYGNAIVPVLAAEFVSAFLDVMSPSRYNIIHEQPSSVSGVSQ